MMRNKLFLLFAILSVFVICLASAAEKKKETDGTKNVKKITVNDDDDDIKDTHDKHKTEREEDDDEIDDSYSPKSSFAHNRFVSHDQSEGNYRTRSRWPSSSESSVSHSMPTLQFTVGEFPDEDEWAAAAYGSASAFPTSSPTHSYNMHRTSHHGPQCHSLIDPQYPIFADTCGAVPQARYSLPNAFGHRDKWQIAQLLTVLASTTSDPACSRSSRLLLCPILFPSCPSRHQPTPVLPCQAFCRAVKARCPTPLLENLPCEILPHTSDLCPVSQGYGSLAPQRSFPHSMPPQSPMTGGHPSSRQQLSALQSLLSSPALQAALSGQGFPTGFAPQAFPSMFPAQNFQPAPVQAPPMAAPVPVTTPPPPPPPVPTTTPMNLYNNIHFPIDTISAMLGETPSRSFGNDYRQGSLYGPGTRSSSDTRFSNDLRGKSNGRSSNSPSMVRA